MDGGNKFIKKRIELGGVSAFNPEKCSVLMNVEEQLKGEIEEQEMALNALNGINATIVLCGMQASISGMPDGRNQSCTLAQTENMFSRIDRYTKLLSITNLK